MDGGRFVFKRENTEYFEFQEKLNSHLVHADNLLDLKEVSPGQLVAVLFTDVCWHRGEVRKVFGDSVEVDLIDMGKRVQISRDLVLFLPKQFTEKGSFSFVSRLTGVDISKGQVAETRKTIDRLIGNGKACGWAQPRGDGIDLFIRVGGGFSLMNKIIGENSNLITTIDASVNDVVLKFK